jgi:hypothetical protein
MPAGELAPAASGYLQRDNGGSDHEVVMAISICPSDRRPARPLPVKKPHHAGKWSARTSLRIISVDWYFGGIYPAPGPHESTGIVDALMDW